jgi:hypothetical protein
MNESYGIIQMFFSLLHVLYTLKDDLAPSPSVGRVEASHFLSDKLRLSSSSQWLSQDLQ